MPSARSTHLAAYGPQSLPVAGLLLALLAACAKRTPTPTPRCCHAVGVEIERLARIGGDVEEGDRRQRVPGPFRRPGPAVTVRDRAQDRRRSGRDRVQPTQPDREGRSRDGIDLAAIDGEAFSPCAASTPSSARSPARAPQRLADHSRTRSASASTSSSRSPATMPLRNHAAHPDPRPPPGPLAPRSREALAAWVRAHPGRFTFDSSFLATFLGR